MRNDLGSRGYVNLSCVITRNAFAGVVCLLNLSMQRCAVWCSKREQLRVFSLLAAATHDPVQAVPLSRFEPTAAPLSTLAGACAEPSTLMPDRGRPALDDARQRREVRASGLMLSVSANSTRPQLAWKQIDKQHSDRRLAKLPSLSFVRFSTSSLCSQDLKTRQRSWPTKEQVAERLKSGHSASCSQPSDSQAKVALPWRQAVAAAQTSQSEREPLTDTFGWDALSCQTTSTALASFC